MILHMLRLLALALVMSGAAIPISPVQAAGWVIDPDG
jgi:hypothetical protein